MSSSEEIVGVPKPSVKPCAYAGVDIGGTKTAVVFATSPPDILWREQFDTRPALGPEHAIRQIINLVHRALAETGVQLVSLGVSCGGPLDVTHGIIHRPPNLPTWDAVPMKKLLEDEFKVSCHVENDANAGAMAEHRFGAGKGCQHLVFLTMGTGLGAGLILDGRVYHGASSMAGEIGHVRLTKDGPEGFHKAGSVEGWASGGGMAQHAAKAVREASAQGRPSLLTQYLPDITAKDVERALRAGDPVAAQIVHRTGVRLGETLAILVDVLNPQRIVIGGLALRFGQSLLQPARDRMREEALSQAVAACSVVAASLGERIGDVAALCVAMREANPAEIPR